MRLRHVAIMHCFRIYTCYWERKKCPNDLICLVLVLKKKRPQRSPEITWKKRNLWLVLYILHEIGSENTRLQYEEMIKRKQLNTVRFFWTLVCCKFVLACTLFKHCKSYNAKQQLRIPYISIYRIYRIICQ